MPLQRPRATPKTLRKLPADESRPTSGLKTDGCDLDLSTEPSSDQIAKPTETLWARLVRVTNHQLWEALSPGPSWGLWFFGAQNISDRRQSYEEQKAGRELTWRQIIVTDANATGADIRDPRSTLAVRASRQPVAGGGFRSRPDGGHVPRIVSGCGGPFRGGTRQRKIPGFVLRCCKFGWQRLSSGLTFRTSTFGQRTCADPILLRPTSGSRLPRRRLVRHHPSGSCSWADLLGCEHRLAGCGPTKPNRTCSSERKPKVSLPTSYATETLVRSMVTTPRRGRRN